MQQQHPSEDGSRGVEMQTAHLGKPQTSTCRGAHLDGDSAAEPWARQLEPKTDEQDADERVEVDEGNGCKEGNGGVGDCEGKEGKS